MATEFNYKRGWAELAGPGFEALPQIYKDLYAEVAARSSEFNQLGDLSVPLLDGIVKRLCTEPDLNLAVAARTIYFWGHWGHTPSATVYYPGLEPKTVTSDMFLGNAVKEYIALMNEYGKPDGEIRTEYHRCGPPNSDGGAHWKLAKMLDQILDARLEVERQEIGGLKGVSIESLEGALRVQTRERGGGWRNLDFCWATAANLERFRELSTLDEEKLIEAFSDEPHHEWFTKDFMDHKEGTKWELSELPKKYQHLVEGAFKILECTTVNHKPHPFVIGQKHFPDANSFSSSIDVHKAPCAMPGCNRDYKAHTSETAFILECVRQLTNAEAAGFLHKLKEVLEADQISLDGFAFVKSEKGFSIDPPIEKEGTDGPGVKETAGAGSPG